MDISETNQLEEYVDFGLLRRSVEHTWKNVAFVRMETVVLGFSNEDPVAHRIVDSAEVTLVPFETSPIAAAAGSGATIIFRLLLLLFA